MTEKQIKLHEVARAHKAKNPKKKWCECLSWAAKNLLKLATTAAVDVLVSKYGRSPRAGQVPE